MIKQKFDIYTMIAYQILIFVSYNPILVVVPDRVDMLYCDLVVMAKLENVVELCFLLINNMSAYLTFLNYLMCTFG